MSTTSSPWAKAPARGLIPNGDEAPISPPSFDQEATFSPALISDHTKRAAAHSSGYGRSPVVLKEKTELENGVSLLEEEPSFRPELPSDAQKRAAAKSSGYGRAIPLVKIKEPASPSFKPELMTKKSPLSSKWGEKARSSAYGKAVAPSRPTTAPAPQFSFKPQLSDDPIRAKAVSSNYGKIAAQAPSRPQSAPSSHDGSFRVDARTDIVYVSRHTLLSDKTEKAPPAEADERQKGFVLDCVKVAAGRVSSAKYGINTEVDFGDENPLPDYEVTLQKKQNAVSSNYGIASPPVLPRPRTAEKPKPFAFVKKIDSFEKAEPRDLPPSTLKFNAQPKVNTREFPAPAERPVTPKTETDLMREAREKSWKISPKITKAGEGNAQAVALGMAEFAEQLPPVPRSKLNDKVAGHNYLKTTPPKKERLPVKQEPLWIPSPAKKGIPTVIEAVPEEHKRKLQGVAGHYGRNYDPKSLYPRVEEEDDLNGSHRPQQRSSPRRQQQQQSSAEEEEYEEGEEEEEVAENEDVEGEDDEVM